jgi:iron-sulfur cluster assembly accessory protein
MLATAFTPTRVVCGVLPNRGGVASTSKSNTWHAAPGVATTLPNHHISCRRAVPSTRLSATGSATGKIEINKAPPTPITLTDGAMDHLRKLKSERGDPKAVLRVGVKSGGCSGMSYVMDFIEKAGDMKPDDTVLSYSDGEIEIRVDPKSLLYLFGLQLDYSSELIGGGYKVSRKIVFLFELLFLL